MGSTLSNWEWTCCEFSTIAFIAIVIICIISAIKGGGTSPPPTGGGNGIRSSKRIPLLRDSDLDRVRNIRFHIREKDGSIFKTTAESKGLPPTLENANYYMFFIDSHPMIYRNVEKIELLDAAGNIIPSEKYCIKYDIHEGDDHFFLHIS